MAINIEQAEDSDEYFNKFRTIKLKVKGVINSNQYLIYKIKIFLSICLEIYLKSVHLI